MALAVLWLPCSPLTLAAGLIWGPWLGLVYSMTAVLASCATTYVLGRFASHAILRLCPRRHHERMKTWQLRASRADWRAVALINLSPVFPAATMGYVFGLVRTPVKLYLSVTAVSLLPFQIAYVLLGSGIAGVAVDRNPWYLLIGLVLVISGTMLVRRLRRRT